MNPFFSRFYNKITTFASILAYNMLIQFTAK